MPSPASSLPPKLRILMLHGYTQSGSLFHAKSRALEKAVIKAFPSSSLHYLTGPVLLDPSSIPGYESSQQTNQDSKVEAYAWWRRQEGATLYEGIEKCLETVAAAIKAEGPFDGVIGFSQGACAAAMVASLLEPERKAAFDAASGSDANKLAYPSCFVAASSSSSSSPPSASVERDGGTSDSVGGPKDAISSSLGMKTTLIQNPLKFAIAYSGFVAPAQHYGAFYEPKIRTPVLNFMGGLDTVVSEERTRALVDACETGEDNLIVHPGGHFLPSQKMWLDAAVAFLRKHTGPGPSGS